MVESKGMGLGRIGAGGRCAFQWLVDALLWVSCLVSIWCV